MDMIKDADYEAMLTISNEVYMLAKKRREHGAMCDEEYYKKLLEDLSEHFTGVTDENKKVAASLKAVTEDQLEYAVGHTDDPVG